MASAVSATYVSQSTNLSFSTTKTLRNETVNVSQVNSDFVIDIDGIIYKNKEPTDSATVTLVGGYDTFAHAKKDVAPKFYITERQKVTIYAILRSLAVKTDKATVNGDSEELDQIVDAIYFNYCG